MTGACRCESVGNASGHRPMLDQPLALVAAVPTLLEVWSIT
jgi:hypothetical protein